MNAVGAWSVVVFILIILVSGAVRKVKIFDVFIKGATEGAKTAFHLLPCLVGLITAVSMLRASGAVELLTQSLSGVLSAVGFPAEVLPLIIIHPISGSGGTAVLNAILAVCGPDSFAGRLASVLCSSSETTFYVQTVYFGSCGIRRTRHALFCGLVSDLAAAIVSLLAVRLFFT